MHGILASDQGYHFMLRDIEGIGLLPTLLHRLSIRADDLATLWLPSTLSTDTLTFASLSLPALDILLKGIALNSLHPTIPVRAVRLRQLSFIGGRLCAEKALLSLHKDNVIIRRDPAGVPQWPDGVTGSITHSSKFASAMVAFSKEPGGLGLDHERLADGEPLDGILSICCTPKDHAYLSVDTRSAIGTLIFSAKESSYKAMFFRLGRIVNFTEFEVFQLDWENSRLWLAPTQNSEWRYKIQPILVNFTFTDDTVMTWVDLRNCLWWTPENAK
jgi:enterobactin synthetase component D